MCLDGTPAPFSFRKINNNINDHHTNHNNEQILIGAGDSYMSLCRKHYLESTDDS
jgi:thymidine kinase